MEMQATNWKCCDSMLSWTHWTVLNSTESALDSVLSKIGFCSIQRCWVLSSIWLNALSRITLCTGQASAVQDRFSLTQRCPGQNSVWLGGVLDRVLFDSALLAVPVLSTIWSPSTVDLSYAHRGSLLSIEEETMRQYMVDNNPLGSCNYRITFYRKRGSFIKQNKLSSNEINKRDLPFSE